MFRILFSVTAASAMMLAAMVETQAQTKSRASDADGPPALVSILSPRVTQQQLVDLGNTAAEATSDFVRHNVAFGSVLVPATATAAFVSKSVTDHSVFAPGAAFTQTFKFKNTGTSTWTGYNLVFVSGSDKLGVAASVAVPTAAPGATVTVNVPLQAVWTSGGSPGAAQLGYWQIRSGSTVIPISGLAFNNPVAKDRVWTAITIDSPTGPGYPRLNSTGYANSVNPYFNIGNGGECTSFAWGRAYELWNIQLNVSSSAGQKWIDALKGSYTVDKTPSANSIAVWSGHVAYVERVTGSGDSATLYLTEANFLSFGKYADLNDPQNTQDPNATKPWWGGGLEYGGSTKSITASEMNSRIKGQTFLGYIHLR